MTDSTSNLLIIEDDLYTRELYEEILKEAGFRVTTAVDGEEGLKKAQEGGFSLILLDVMMPKLDGLEILRNLRNHPSDHPNGPAVVLTNLARDPVLKEAMQLGAKACIIKTDLNPDQVVDKVKSFLIN